MTKPGPDRCETVMEGKNYGNDDKGRTPPLKPLNATAAVSKLASQNCSRTDCCSLCVESETLSLQTPSAGCQ
jgi:hypothetical protein